MPSSSDLNYLVVDRKIISVVVVGICLGVSVIVIAVILCNRLRQRRDGSKNYVTSISILTF